MKTLQVVFQDMELRALTLQADEWLVSDMGELAVYLKVDGGRRKIASFASGVWSYIRELTEEPTDAATT